MITAGKTIIGCTAARETTVRLFRTRFSFIFMPERARIGGQADRLGRERKEGECSSRAIRSRILIPRETIFIGNSALRVPS